jgi:hypothetical protein
MNIEYVIGAILALLGALVYERTKRKASDALLGTLETKKELLKDDAEIEKNKALLTLEEEKRKELEKKDAKDDLSSLNDFFNKP